ncbi:MAG TPA: PAS domain S-box protein [Syntrophomonadaceae bacterium]|nr:PAS domain S-box protein [Syntrophomonadaceae bacterium]
MENDLKFELNRYKYIIENLKDVIWEMNNDFAFTFVTPNDRDMSWYEAEELIGRKITEFLVEDSQEYFYDQVTRHVNERINGDPDKTVLHDMQFICQNGLVKWVQVAANLMFEEGKFIGYIGTTRDISEKKDYERKLNRYIEELKLVNSKLEKNGYDRHSDRCL